MMEKLARYTNGPRRKSISREPPVAASAMALASAYASDSGAADSSPITWAACAPPASSTGRTDGKRAGMPSSASRNGSSPASRPPPPTTSSASMSKRLPARKLASVCFSSRIVGRQRLAQHAVQLRRQRRRRRPARADQERFVAFGQLGALGFGGERLRDRGGQVLAAAPDGARVDRVAAAHDADVGAHVPEVEHRVARHRGVVARRGDGREQRPVGDRRGVDGARVNPLRLRRPDQRRQVVAPRRHRHHRRPSGRCATTR